MFKINEFNQGGPELPEGSVTVPEPPGPEVLQTTTSGVGVSKSPRKTTTIYTRRKIKTRTTKNPRRKWDKSEYMNALECLLRAEEKGVKKGIGKIVHDLWIEMGIWEIDEKNLMNQIRMIKSKGWVTNIEIETIRRKIENEGRDEVNEGTIKESDNTADFYDENGDINHADSANEEPIRIVENVLSESERDRLLRLREALEGNDFGKTEVNLKYGDKEKIKEEVKKMNKVLEHVKITGFTHCRNVIQAAMRIVGEEVGMKKSNAKKKKEPFWKRRILRDISRLRKDLSRIEAWFAGRWKNDKNKEKDLLDQKYGLRRKGFSLVMEELKQRITTKATKVKRYGNRIKQFQDNRNFQTNQGRFFKNLEGKKERTKPPNAEDATAFWKGIWSTKVEHKRDAGWIGKVKENMPSEKQNTVNITKDDVKRKLKSMPDWKGAGPDKIQGFWLKSFTALHGVLAAALNECIEAGDVPGWLVEGRTILVMKDSKNGTEVGKYRPIACLNLIWKLLTGIIRDKTYDHLEKNRLLPEEQKGRRRKCQGTKDQLAIDRCILQNCRKRKTNLSMAWVDYRKAYDMVPHSWIIDTMGMVGLADNIILNKA